MRNNYLRLTGGLGNQLFQLSYGLSLKSRLAIIHFDELNPEIENLLYANSSSTEKILIRNLNKHLFLKKLMNLALRLSTKQERIRLVKLYGFVLSVPISLTLREKIRVEIATGTGKTETKKNMYSTMHIGYFQYEGYARKFKELSWNTNWSSPVVDEYRELAKKENPIMVQIRLGDYRQNPSLGIPSPEYFKNAISRLTINPTDKIWLFSNDINGAAIILTEAGVSNYRMIDDNRLSDFQTIQVLNFGRSFAISNSTFGWWGAYLRSDQNAEVICPNPWFKSVESPRGLIPEGWKLENSRFDDSL